MRFDIPVVNLHLEALLELLDLRCFKDLVAVRTAELVPGLALELGVQVLFPALVAD